MMLSWIFWVFEVIAVGLLCVNIAILKRHVFRVMMWPSFPHQMPSEILFFISSVIGEMLTAVELKGIHMNEVILSQVFHLEWELKRIMARQISYFTTFCLQQHDFQSGTELLPMAATVAMGGRWKESDVHRSLFLVCGIKMEKCDENCHLHIKNVWIEICYIQ